MRCSLLARASGRPKRYGTTRYEQRRAETRRPSRDSGAAAAPCCARRARPSASPRRPRFFVAARRPSSAVLASRVSDSAPRSSASSPCRRRRRRLLGVARPRLARRDLGRRSSSRAVVVVLGVLRLLERGQHRERSAKNERRSGSSRSIPIARRRCLHRREVHARPAA